MTKVHPDSVSRNPCSDPDSAFSEFGGTLTVWMKSLVHHCNGCTVFNSRGKVAFRVDNYQEKNCREVFLMDSAGRVLFSINRKRVGILGHCWDGYRWNKGEQKRPFIRVTRNRRILRRNMSYCKVVVVGSDHRSCYRIQGSLGAKAAFRITEISSGQQLAEGVRKESCLGGLSLGEDVLNLTVASHVHQSLAMALFIVYAMINTKL